MKQALPVAAGLFALTDDRAVRVCIASITRLSEKPDLHDMEGEVCCVEVNSSAARLSRARVDSLGMRACGAPHGVVGELCPVEVIDDEACVGQQPWSAVRLGVDGGRIDRDEQDRLPELDALLLEPVHTALAGASFPLLQQPLITVQIDEAGVVGVHLVATARCRCLGPSGAYPGGSHRCPTLSWVRVR